MRQPKFNLLRHRAAAQKVFRVAAKQDSRDIKIFAIILCGKCSEKPLNKMTGIQKLNFAIFVLFGLRQSSYLAAAGKKTKSRQIPAIIQSHL